MKGNRLKLAVGIVLFVVILIQSTIIVYLSSFVLSSHLVVLLDYNTGATRYAIYQNDEKVVELRGTIGVVESINAVSYGVEGDWRHALSYSMIELILNRKNRGEVFGKKHEGYRALRGISLLEEAFVFGNIELEDKKRVKREFLDILSERGALEAQRYANEFRDEYRKTF